MNDTTNTTLWKETVGPQCFEAVYINGIIYGALKIKKICFSSKVPIQLCRPNSDSAPSEAIWAQFKAKEPHQKAIPAHAGTHFIPWIQIIPG